MKLSKLEQESIILYNEEESTASIYTHDPKLKRKLKRLAEKYPDKVYPDRAVHAGAVSYAVPKSCVSVREPFSDERRRAASERAKNAGYTGIMLWVFEKNVRAIRFYKASGFVASERKQSAFGAVEEMYVRKL